MPTPRPWQRRVLILLLALAALTPAVRTQAALNNRLERDVLPTFESLKLKLDPSRPDYNGSVHIDLHVAKETETFTLYAKDMDVISVRLSNAAGELKIEAAPGPNDQLVVRSGTPIPVGDYGLDINFENNFDQRANSLYRLKSGTNWYCFTQFEAVAAREAFPCWDEPEFKIPFQVTVTVPATSTAISNVPIQKESTTGDRRTVIFERTPPLPSYLVAIATGPFDSRPIKGMSVPGRVVTVKGASALAAEAARLAPSLLTALEKYFGRPYPYAKLDLLAVPEFAAGAMENAGAITFRDEILLVDPATATLRQRQRLAAIIAHEMAHMWFGDLVTMAWWDDLWLNESFASWMGDKVTDQVFPQYNMSVRELSGTQQAMVTDARLSTRAVRQSVDAFANIDRLFDELSYQKGQAVLGMLESWLTPEVFRKGLTAYLKEHEWQNATAADLWKALSTASGRDITPATNSFLDQGGVPLVSAEIRPGGSVRLAQRRFLNYGVTAPLPAAWKIPVTLRYSDGKQSYTQSLLLSEAEQTVKLEKTTAPVWVHPNAGERGYYRWQMSLESLDALEAVAPKALDARERVGFLNNAAALLDGGQIAGDDYLRLLEGMSDDPAPDVVTAQIAGIEKVYKTFISPDLRASYAIAVRRMLRPALKRVGMQKARGEADAVTLMRPGLLTALGVYGMEKEVMDWARPAARRYLTHPDSVESSVVGTALNLAARDGDMALFDSYRERFETTSIPSERARFLTALGNFRRSESIERALDYALTGPLRPQEVLTIPSQMTENDELRERAWRWFRTGYKGIVRRVPPFYLPDLPQFASGCDTLRTGEAQAFFSFPDANLSGTQEDMAKVAEGNRDCTGLRGREQPAVARYLLNVRRITPGPARATGS
jgi:alanyl aminopeptidase